MLIFITFQNLLKLPKENLHSALLFFYPLHNLSFFLLLRAPQHFQLERFKLVTIIMQRVLNKLGKHAVQRNEAGWKIRMLALQHPVLGEEGICVLSLDEKQ